MNSDERALSDIGLALMDAMTKTSKTIELSLQKSQEERLKQEVRNAFKAGVRWFAAKRELSYNYSEVRNIADKYAQEIEVPDWIKIRLGENINE